MYCRFCNSRACYDQVKCGQESRLEIESAIEARADYGEQIEEKNLHPEDATANLLRVAGDLLAKWRTEKVKC
jgi:hypothetical protein